LFIKQRQPARIRPGNLAGVATGILALDKFWEASYAGSGVLVVIFSTKRM